MKRKKELIEWNALRDRAGMPPVDSTEEPSRANPDQLAEGQQLWGDSEITEAQRLMGEAVSHLQGRQKEVYLLSMRSGKTQAEIAAMLAISPSSVQEFKARAIKFITDYCRAAIKRGEPK